MSDIFFQSKGADLTYFILLKNKISAYDIILLACQSNRTSTSNINLNILEAFAERSLGLNIMEYVQKPSVSVSISSFCYQ
jgi:hypothetical protein